MVDSAADGAVEGPWAVVWDDMEELAAVRVGTLYISPKQLKCVPLTWLGHWLSGQMKSAWLGWPVVIVRTDTLYISTKQLRCVQCIVASNNDINLTQTLIVRPNEICLTWMTCCVRSNWYTVYFDRTVKMCTVILTRLRHWLSGQMKSAQLRWPVVIVQTDTLYISTKQLKHVQCIVRGGIHISPTQTVSILAAWHWDLAVLPCGPLYLWSEYIYFFRDKLYLHGGVIYICVLLPVVQ